MRRIITINSNQVNKSVETKKILTEKLTNAGFEVTYEFCQDAELIISIGGDGSFLKTVHDFDFTKTPIIGTNTGHLGFFPEISPNHIDSFIKSYKNNDFLVQDISLLKANICTNNCNSNMYAINEVVVKGDKSRTIHLSLDVNGKHIHLDYKRLESPYGVIERNPTEMKIKFNDKYLYLNFDDLVRKHGDLWSK